MRLQEIRDTLASYDDDVRASRGSCDVWDFSEEVRYLLNLVETMKAENPEFWSLYDRFQDKIAEKLKLKDENELLKKRLERYEIALKEITQVATVHSNDYIALMAKAAIVINNMRTTAVEALKEE